MNLNALINTVLNESTINFSDYDLGKKFDHYNTTLFNGEIPKIPVYWAKLKGVGGITVAKVEKPSNGRGGYNRYHGVTLIEGSLEIKISNILKRSEDDLNGIIIHEMIHAYFISKHMFDVNHGYKFVFNDLEVWYPKLKQFGVMCGDDYGSPSGVGVVKAVTEFAHKYGLLVSSSVEDKQFWFVKT